MRFKVNFGKRVGVVNAMYLSSYKSQQRIVYFSGKRRKFAFIILLHQTTK